MPLHHCTRPAIPLGRQLEGGRPRLLSPSPAVWPLEAPEGATRARGQKTLEDHPCADEYAKGNSHHLIHVPTRSVIHRRNHSAWATRTQALPAATPSVRDLNITPPAGSQRPAVVPLARIGPSDTGAVLHHVAPASLVDADPAHGARLATALTSRQMFRNWLVDRQLSPYREPPRPRPDHPASRGDDAGRHPGR